MDSKRNSAPMVLVVDDQDTLKHFMRKTLESAGFRVLTANSGADALTLFRSAGPPIVLLVTDYNMPRMTGLELAQECCGLDSGLGVLYVSGSTPDDDLLADLARGKRDFLPKPFRPSELLRRAKALLEMEPVAAPPWEIHGARTERLNVEG